MNHFSKSHILCIIIVIIPRNDGELEEVSKNPRIQESNGVKFPIILHASARTCFKRQWEYSQYAIVIDSNPNGLVLLSIF